jgi:hypothetical protein
MGSFDNGNEPSDSIRGGYFCTSRVNISLTGRTLLCGVCWLDRYRYWRDWKYVRK